jgi:sodium/potassium-transporting ATPase subunit alpha
MPFIVFVLLGFPLPLTTQLILAIDLGTDIFPAISFAYEPTELDIMKRKPRDAKKDRLVTTKLIVFSYLLIGVIQAAASFFCFFTVMYDFGFKASGLPNLNTAKYHNFDDNGGNELLLVQWLDNEEGMLHFCGRWGQMTGAPLGDMSNSAYPLITPVAIDSVPVSGRCSGPLFTVEAFDRYCQYKDPNSWYNRCSLNSGRPTPATCAKRYGTTSHTTAIAGLMTVSRQGALFKRDKHGFPDCTAAKRVGSTGIYLPWGVWSDDGQKRVDEAMYGTTCQFPESRSSRVETHAENGDDYVHVCYSTDALKYAQSAYFVSMPMVQFSNMWFCKTRKLSLLHQGMRNMFMNYSVIGEMAVALALLYIPFMNILFGTRPIAIWHFMIPAMPFAVWIFIFDETRKYFVRQGDTPAGRAITGAPYTMLGAWMYSHSYY